MKIFVYNMRAFDELALFEKYCAQYGLEYDYIDGPPVLENLDLAKGYDAVNIITTPFDAAMLEKLHGLGTDCVITRTIGYDHIDTIRAGELGMSVGYISYSPNTVADYTIMMILMGLRKVKYVMQCAQAQSYSLEKKLGRELGDCTVGVIGTGRIGRAVIRELSGFGCRILAYNVNPTTPEPPASFVDFDTLLAESDIITLHAPGTEKNYHMIGAEQIARMKPGVHLINCARGSLIDTQALLDGIESGQIGFAGVDVIENEKALYYYDHRGDVLPNRDKAVLESYPNVIVSPHMAFYTETAVSNMVEHSIIETIRALKERK